MTVYQILFHIGSSGLFLVLICHSTRIYGQWCGTDVWFFIAHRSEDDRNPGNNLYVTGLSARVTEDDLEKFFSKEGKVCSQIY